MSGGGGGGGGGPGGGAWGVRAGGKAELSGAPAVKPAEAGGASRGCPPGSPASPAPALGGSVCGAGIGGGVGAPAPGPGPRKGGFPRPCRSCMQPGLPPMPSLSFPGSDPHPRHPEIRPGPASQAETRGTRTPTQLLQAQGSLLLPLGECLRRLLAPPRRPDFLPRLDLWGLAPFGVPPPEPCSCHRCQHPLMGSVQAPWGTPPKTQIQTRPGPAPLLTPRGMGDPAGAAPPDLSRPLSPTSWACLQQHPHAHPGLPGSSCQPARPRVSKTF